MALLSGYIFATKAIANAAMTTLNTEHGLPVNGFITKFSSESYLSHPDGFYYIPYDEEWTHVLGEPVEIVLPNRD